MEPCYKKEKHSSTVFIIQGTPLGILTPICNYFPGEASRGNRLQRFQLRTNGRLMAAQKGKHNVYRESAGRKEVLKLALPPAPWAHTCSWACLESVQGEHSHLHTGD